MRYGFGMRLPILVVLLLAWWTGCSATASYRGIDGHPVPTTARLDADGDPVLVSCDGMTYAIVTAPLPYATGTHLATRRPFVRDPAVMCARISRT